MKSAYISHPGFEAIFRVEDEESGLFALVAIHNTKLGPALGGCRCMVYEDEAAQFNDVLRLAEGMTHKNSACGINHGGGKTAVDASKIKNRDLAFERLGNFINTLSGTYIIAGDVGTDEHDLRMIQKSTKWVGGIDIDSSGPTAMGVYACMMELLGRYNSDVPLNETIVNIQGLGKVGSKLTKLLLADGVTINAYDPVVKEMDGVNMVSEKDIYNIAADVFAPCALGGAINEDNFADLTVEFICGAANNQFSSKQVQEWASEKFYYVPDFVANAGGVMAVALNKEMTTGDFDSLREIVRLVTHEDDPQDAAIELARKRITDEIG